MPKNKMVIIGIVLAILVVGGFIYYSKDLIEKGASAALKRGKMTRNSSENS